MNELKPESVMKELELQVQRHLIPNVDIDGTVSVEDAERWFLKLLKEKLSPYISALFCEKDAEIRRLQPVLCEECRHLQKVKGRIVYGTCQATGLTFAAFGVAGLDAKSFFCAYGERGK